MANHPSAARRNRQRIKQAARNRNVKSSTRSALRKARAALAAGDTKLAETLVREVECKLDRAASKGVIHDKAASRVKSRLYTQLGKLTSAS